MANVENQAVVLTQRETQALTLVSDGYSAKEIAKRICIAPRTVERHIENIRLKVRARNRAHMVTCALTLGLMATPIRFMPLATQQDVHPLLYSTL